MSPRKQKSEWPHLTVIVTTYNVEKFVTEALDSVVNQTYPNLDVLVVDDGSTDNTRGIVQEFIDRGAPITMIALEQNTPGGVAYAANRGIDAVTSDFVGFLDGDDTCEPDIFQALVETAMAAQADVALCDYRLFYDDDGSVTLGSDSERFVQLASQRTVIDKTDTQNLARVLAFNAVPWRKIYRTALLQEHSIRFPESDIFWEDNPFHWFVVLSASRIALCNDVGFYHRMNRVGQTMSEGSASLVRMFEHGTTIEQWLTQRQLIDAYAPLLAQWAISQFEWISRRLDSAEDFDTALTAMRPFVQRLDDIGFEAALSKKGQTSYDLMSALRAGETISFDAFSARRKAAQQPRGRISGLMVRATDYVKRFGVRKTIRQVARSLRVRLGLALLADSDVRPTKKHVAWQLENVRLSQEILWQSAKAKQEALERRIESLEQKLNDDR